MSTPAQDFFAELEAFSREVRQLYTGSPALSPNGNAAYRAVAQPLLPSGAKGVAGAIVHYTAGGSACSAVRTFCDPAVGNGRSAHVVIERGWPDSCQVIRGRYPTVGALPAMPVQCRLPSTEGVHATWCNRWAWSAELVSWGKLTPENPAGPQVSAWGTKWQVFTDAQLTTVATLLVQLQNLAPTFSAANIYSHEQVQMPATPGCGGENKIDTGPILDVLDLRRRVRDPAQRAAVAACGPGKVDPEGVQMLRALGYYDGGPIAAPLAVFQFAAGLTPDGQLGPKSKAALSARIRDRMGPDADAVLARCLKVA